MTKTTRILLSTAILALSACSPLVYGKLDVPTITVTNKIPGTIQGYAGQLTVPLDLFPEGLPFTVGDVTVDESSKDSSIKLNSAEVKITTPDTAVTKITFTGIQSAELALVQAGTTKSIAKYDAAGKIGSISTDGKTLTLVPTSDLELLSYLKNQTLTVKVGVAGTPPSATWTGEVTLDFHIIAQKNVL